MAFDLDKYFDAVDAARVADPNLRLGQAMFNQLHTVDRVAADSICGGDLDPYYRSKPDDPSIVKYLDWLREVSQRA